MIFFNDISKTHCFMHETMCFRYHTMHETMCFRYHTMHETMCFRYHTIHETMCFRYHTMHETMCFRYVVKEYHTMLFYPQLYRAAAMCEIAKNPLCKMRIKEFFLVM